MSRWYYIDADTHEEVGPFSANELQQAVRDGHISSDTLVRADAERSLKAVDSRPASSVEITCEALHARHDGLTVTQLRLRRVAISIGLFLLITFPIALIRNWVGEATREAVLPSQVLPPDQPGIASTSTTSFVISGEPFQIPAPVGYTPLSRTSRSWPLVASSLPDGAALMATFLTSADANRDSSGQRPHLADYIAITSLSDLNRSPTGISLADQAYSGLRQQFLSQPQQELESALAQVRTQGVQAFSVVYADDLDDSSFVVVILVSQTVGGQSNIRATATGLAVRRNRLIQISATRPYSAAGDVSHARRNVEYVLGGIGRP